MIYTDRSRIETGQHCKQARWWEYEYGGSGVVPIGTSHEAAVGIAVHEGLAMLMASAAEGITHSLEEQAVDLARLKFAEMPIGAYEWEVLPEVARIESLEVVEALVRLGARQVVPKLLKKYKVLSVEREGVAELAPGLVWMSRDDGDLEDEDGWVLSWKVIAKWDQDKRERPRHALQTAAEEWAFEQRTGRKPVGTVTVYLIAGEVKKDEVRGVRERDSILTRAYLSPKGEWFTQYWGWDEEVGQRVKAVPRYSKKVRVKDHMSTKEWVAGLSDGDLRGLWFGPFEHRSRGSMSKEMFKTIVLAEEEDWKKRMEGFAWLMAEGVGFERASTECFPRSTWWCEWCSYGKLCWPENGVVPEPLEVGFRWREPNHPVERDRLVELIRGESE